MLAAGRLHPMEPSATGVSSVGWFVSSTSGGKPESLRLTSRAAIRSSDFHGQSADRPHVSHFLLKTLKLLQVTATASSPFVDNQIVERNEMGGYAEEYARYPVWPRLGEFNPA
jgi:hypothetical protein